MKQAFVITTKRKIFDDNISKLKLILFHKNGRGEGDCRQLN